MSDAIKELNVNEDYIFIAINEDNNPNYLKQLPILRDMTTVPIFVITTNYTFEKEMIARKYGADEYAVFQENLEKNTIVAFEILKSHTRIRQRQTDQPLPVLIHDDIILSPSRRIVYVNENELSLSKKEFDILHFLISKSGYVVSHEQILHKIWGSEYDEHDVQLLWRTIDRLRNKISKFTSKDYIIIERGIGYKLVLA